MYYIYTCVLCMNAGLHAITPSPLKVIMGRTTWKVRGVLGLARCAGGHSRPPCYFFVQTRGG